MQWLARNRPLAFALICLSWAVIIVSGQWYPELPFWSLPWSTEQDFQDYLRREGRKTAPRPDFVFLGIDQTSLELPVLSADEIANNRAFQLMTERPFPWSREVWALLLDRLCDAGARLVVFDMIFNPSNDGDAAFAAALARHRDRVVLGDNIDLQGSELAKMPQLVVPNKQLIPPPAEDDDRVGYVNFFLDPSDNKLRTVRFYVTDRLLARLAPNPSAKVYRALSTRALLKLGHGGAVIRDERDHPFRFSANGSYRPRPLYEVFDPKFWHANYQDGTFFKDKIVVVGASSQVAHDFVNTPMDPTTPGPTVHLQVMAAAMSHEWLFGLRPIYVMLLVVGAAVAAWLINALVRRPLLGLLLLLGVCIAYLITARVAYDRSGLLLATIPVLSTFLLGGVSTLGLDYALERIEKVRTRRTLERYVSKNLVKEILENPSGFYSNMRGARKPITVLFSDLVGFTTLSEHADPEELVRQLNEYLTEMVRVVFENDGTLDKFIGDAIMAVWGNVTSKGGAGDAKACARAALCMRRELRKLNARWRTEGRMTLGMGVGINHGEALVGNIGSSERQDPTVIGDAVNLASRLESLTRIYGVDILVGATAAELIKDEFHLRSVARAQVKGKTYPVDVYTIIDSRMNEVDPEILRWLDTYEDGVRKFRERDFTEAKILFSRYLEFYPDDLLAKIYLERALEYETAPPDGDWRAVEVFRGK